MLVIFYLHAVAMQNFSLVRVNRVLLKFSLRLEYLFRSYIEPLQAVINVVIIDETRSS